MMMRRIQVLVTLIAALAPIARAGDGPAAPADLLSPEQHQLVESANTRALLFLAGQQEKDGSFPSPPIGKPGVTALCVLAFLSAGHLPGKGQYGPAISGGIDYVLSCQRPDGTFSIRAPEPAFTDYSFAHTTIYNHAICSLMLTEAYGMVDAATSVRLRAAIEKAKNFTLNLQVAPKARAEDLGGWRYVRTPNDVCSDPPVTSWQLLFLRSAKNAGFDVPADRIAMAVDYMKRNFDPRVGTFQYYSGRNVPLTRGTAGAGILTLSLGGKHATPEALSAADWILAHPFVPYKNQVSTNDRYFYALFYCTTALFQLGGKHWILFYPQTARVLVANQSPDGSWDADPHGGDRMFGNSYSTALACLALNTPKQLLPIFQR